MSIAEITTRPLNIAPNPRTPPVALTVAGSDSSAGAGIQADLKTFAAHEVYGINVVTALVAESPGAVISNCPVDSTLLNQQLYRVKSAFPINSIKTGMLATADIVEAVAAFRETCPDIPLVIDPVMRAGAGAELLTRDGLSALQKKLIPLASLVTPNLPEAERLLGTSIRSKSDFSDAPRQLFERYGSAFLVKGGHFSDGVMVTDYAWIEGELLDFSRPRLQLPDVHGTGCTLSAAIAAQLARGRTLREAIRMATVYLNACLEQHFAWNAEGSSIEALNHFPHGVEFL